MLLNSPGGSTMQWGRVGICCAWQDVLVLFHVCVSLTEFLFFIVFLLCWHFWFITKILINIDWFLCALLFHYILHFLSVQLLTASVFCDFFFCSCTIWAVVDALSSDITLTSDKRTCEVVYMHHVWNTQGGWKKWGHSIADTFITSKSISFLLINSKIGLLVYLFIYLFILSFIQSLFYFLYIFILLLINLFIYLSFSFLLQWFWCFTNARSQTTWRYFFGHPVLTDFCN